MSKCFHAGPHLFKVGRSRRRVQGQARRRATSALAWLLSGGVALTAANQAAALEITEQTDADTLASLLFPGTDGLIYTNGTATLMAHTEATVFIFDDEGNVIGEETIDTFSSGTFTNASGTYGIGNGSAAGPEGVAFSTGDVRNYGDSFTNVGVEDFSVGATLDQQDLLFPITGIDSHNDVTQLTIPFDNTTGSAQPLNIFAVFGSEEFPAFVNSQFNDGFGAYLNGENVALVNDRPMNVDHPQMAPIFSTRLTGVISNVTDTGFDPRHALQGMAQPGANELTLIIGDASDDVVSSTVYLSRDTIDGPIPDQPELPDAIDPETGGFIFDDIDLGGGETIFIDPVFAIGYDYEAIGSVATPDPRFQSVQVLPMGDDMNFLISFGSVEDEPITAGQVFLFTDFELDGVSAFTITGISPTDMLDPTDPLAFVTGVSFTTAVEDITVVQTPIVPEPAAASLLGLGLVAIAHRRRSA